VTAFVKCGVVSLWIFPKNHSITTPDFGANAPAMKNRTTKTNAAHPQPTGTQRGNSGRTSLPGVE
jgi:hypothetical protein